MCGTCGCGKPDAGGHEHGHDHHHSHEHHHEHTHAADSTTLIQVEKALLAENDRFAAENRALFDERRTRCFNLISGPGAGKTTLLEKTLAGLWRARWPARSSRGTRRQTSMPAASPQPARR